MRSHSLRPHRPVNTRRSVPRLMPLNSVRTRASPGAGRGRGAGRNSAAPRRGVPERAGHAGLAGRAARHHLIARRLPWVPLLADERLA